MYFVAERQEDNQLIDMSLELKLKAFGMNIYILTFIVFDLVFIKRNAYETGIASLTEVLTMLTYFFLAESYGLYMYLKGEQKVKPEQISWRGTIFLHGASFFKSVLFGFCLCSSRHQYFSVYFMVRFTIYASTFFFILSHLRVIRKFVLKKGELKTVNHRHCLWQLSNFNKVFYATLLGNTIDVIGFGNDLNYYTWLSFIAIWALYKFKTFMTTDRNWKYLKHLFESQ